MKKSLPRVPEVSLASIKGLQGLKFVDKTVEGTPTLEEARDEVWLKGSPFARYIYDIFNKSKQPSILIS